MNLEQQKKHFEEFVNTQKEIMLKKGNDYSNEDRLSNFKKVALMNDSTPEEVILGLISTKVARLVNLLKGNKTPNNESVRDSNLDLANYTILLDMLLAEKNQKVVSKDYQSFQSEDQKAF